MSRRDSRIIELRVDFVASTEKAYLLSDGEREAWFPRSQVNLDSSRPELGLVASMPEWLAIDKEFV